MNSLKKNLRIYFLFLLILINIFIFYYLFHLSNPNLKVSFLDVGQGDAIFVDMPNGRQMLIDGGPNNSVLRELGKVMPFFDRSIDVVLATHVDADHIGGLVEVLKRFEVDLFIRTNSTSTSAVYEELAEIIKAKNIREEIIVSPVDIMFGVGVNFNILFPLVDTASWEVNDSSIVAKLSYGENSFLFTGDSPKIVEDYLVKKYGTFLDSDILKIGHHGSKTSSSELFLGTVSPTYSIISAGADNSYGHPHAEILEILNTFSENILATLGHGTISVISDGQNLNISKGFFYKF
jgi:competence protein ComEC